MNINYKFIIIYIFERFKLIFTLLFDTIKSAMPEKQTAVNISIFFRTGHDEFPYYSSQLLQMK